MNTDNQKDTGTLIVTEIARLSEKLAKAFASFELADGKDLARTLTTLLSQALPSTNLGQKDQLRAVRFLVNHLATGQLSSPERFQMTNKAAFLWLTLFPDSHLSRLLASLARLAYYRTAGALNPYLDEHDLLELLRWRLWNLKPSYFSPAKLLQSQSIVAFLSTIARHLAIDQLRRLATHRFDPIPTSDEMAPTLQSTEPDVLDTIIFYQELDQAVHRASFGMPVWLRQAAVDALMEHLPREQILSHINRHRSSQGYKPWDANTFRVFLSRFRKKIRQSFS